MPNKIYKTAGLLAMAFLVYWDFAVCYDAFCGEYTTGECVNQILNFSLPCGCLTAIAAFCGFMDYKGKKPMAIISTAVNILLFIVRIFAFVFQIYLIAIGQGETGFDETVLIVQFAAYTVLLLANVFFMIYILKGKFMKTSVIVFCLSAFTLIADWVILCTNTVKTLMSEGYTLISSLIQCFDSSFIQSIIAVLAYLIVYATVIDVLKKRDFING